MATEGDRGERGMAKPDQAPDRFPLPQFLHDPSVDTSLVKLVRGGHYFSVPRNFIRGALMKDGKLLLILMMTYPKFEGITQETAEMARWGAGSSNAPNLIEVGLRDTGSYETNRKRMVKLAMEKTKDVGLIQLDDPGSESFVHIGNSEEDSFFVRCSGRAMNVDPCHIRFDFSKTIPVDIIFHKTLIGDSKRIFDGVVANLRSFMER